MTEGKSQKIPKKSPKNRKKNEATRPVTSLFNYYDKGGMPPVAIWPLGVFQINRA